MAGERTTSRTTWLLSVLALSAIALSAIATTNPVPTGVTILQTDSVPSVSYPRVRNLTLVTSLLVFFPLPRAADSAP